MSNKSQDPCTARADRRSRRPRNDSAYDSTNEEVKRPGSSTAVFFVQGPVEGSPLNRQGRRSISQFYADSKARDQPSLRKSFSETGTSSLTARTLSGTNINTGMSSCGRSSALESPPVLSGSQRTSRSSGISVDDSERNVSDGSLTSLQAGGTSDRSSLSSSTSDYEEGKASKKVESSLMLHVKGRAPPSYTGFVDAVTLAPARLLQTRGVRVFNELVTRDEHTPMNSESWPRENLRLYLDKLNGKHASTSLQILLTDVLPRLDYQCDLCAIAECLSAGNLTVQTDGASRLERLLISVIKWSCSDVSSEKTDVTERVLGVAHKTRDVILSQQPLDSHVLRMCGHLHMLATSCLVCHNDRALTAEEWRSVTSWTKPPKKQVGDAARQSLLKLLSLFFEHFERHMKEMKAGQATLRGDRKKFSRASLFEQFVVIYSVLTEVAEKDWSEQARALLEELAELHEAVHKEGRHKAGQEARAALDWLLVRGLMVLLNTTYAKVREQVGEAAYDHPKLTSELLVRVVRRANRTQQEDLEHDVSNLLFHESPLVSEPINNLLPESELSRLVSVFDHLENSLLVTNFRVDRPGSSGTLRRDDVKSGGGKTCSWHAFRGHFGRKQGAEGAVYVHTARCQAKAPHYDCQHGSHSKFTSLQPHELHMDTLRQLPAHENVLRLLAFQHSPYGFYATEEIKDRRLLEHLLNHRASHRWLDTPILCTIALHIVSGLQFLASRGIASRDVTAYDMLVLGLSRRRGTAGEVMEVLLSGDFTVQLANLGLAHQFRAGNGKSGKLRAVTEQGPVPLLWTPREGLLRGEYSDSSMVYSLGVVLYELWTHGGQPFTTQHKATLDTLREMLQTPESVILIHWPCMEEAVYRLIQRCTTTDPARRPSLAETRQYLETIRSSPCQQDSECLVETPGGQEQDYPPLMDEQVTRKYVPQRGIPREIQQLIDDIRKSEFQPYKNLRESGEQDDVSYALMATEAEFRSSEWVEVFYEGDSTVVREKLTQKFVQDVLPALVESTDTGSEMKGVTDWLKDPLEEPRLEEESKDYAVQERRYPLSWNLQELASMGMLAASDDDGYVTMSPDRYVLVFVSLTHALHELHERGWLHRDLRASNVLVVCHSGEAIFMRIGRMCQVTSSHESAVEEVFEDTRRWLAPEVLREGKYSRGNDVFMLGTAFWETFRAREIMSRNRAATAIHFVPFADREKGEVVSLVRAGTPLPRPAGCPDWLYDLIIKCRLPKPKDRPSVTQILDILLEKVPKGRLSQRASNTSASEQAMFPPPGTIPTASSAPYLPDPPKRHQAHKVKLYASPFVHRVLGNNIALPTDRTPPRAVHEDQGKTRRRPSLPSPADLSQIQLRISGGDGCDYLTPTSVLEEPSKPSAGRVHRKTSAPSAHPFEAGAPASIGAMVPGVGIGRQTRVFTRADRGCSSDPGCLGPADAEHHALPDSRELDVLKEREDEEHVYDSIHEVDTSTGDSLKMDGVQKHESYSC